MKAIAVLALFGLVGIAQAATDAEIQKAEKDWAKAVMAQMKKLPINDFMTKDGKVREDGRVIRDMYLMQVKTPEESKGPWDLAKIIATVPGDEAFRPLSDGACPLVKK